MTGKAEKEEEHGWVKVTISKYRDDVFYEYINYDHLEPRREGSELMMEFCEDIAEREGIGQNTSFRYSWEVIDLPPEDVLVDKLERLDSDIAGLQNMRETLGNQLTKLIVRRYREEAGEKGT